MDVDPVELSPGALAAFLWQVIKWIIRMILKNPDWSIPVKWNVLAVAVLAYLIVPLLAFLGIGSYQFPSSWPEFFRQLIVLILQVLVGMSLHAIALAPASSTAKARSRSRRHNAV